MTAYSSHTGFFCAWYIWSQCVPQLTQPSGSCWHSDSAVEYAVLALSASRSACKFAAEAVCDMFQCFTVNQ